jgi:hypothetical protein
MQAKWKTDIETYKEKAAAAEKQKKQPIPIASDLQRVLDDPDRSVKKKGLKGFFNRAIPDFLDKDTGYYSQDDLKKQHKANQKKWAEEHPLTPYGTDALKPDSKFAKAYIAKRKAAEKAAAEKAATEKAATAKTNVISTKDKSGKWNPPVEDILEKQGTGYEAEKMSNKLSFDEAFAAARKKGLEIFQWRNKLYSTVITKE